MPIQARRVLFGYTFYVQNLLYTFWVHETGWTHMQVSFGSSELAVLCNSEAALARQWGLRLARTVGCRLFDLSAVSASTIGLIPGAAVTSHGDGAITITFSDEIVVRGVIAATTTTTDHILISSLDVHGSDPK